MKPFRYHVLVNKTSMLSLICTIWLVSYITAVSVYIVDKPDFKGYCQFEKIYLVREAFFFMTVTCIIPMTSMLILYGALVKVARKQVTITISLEVSSSLS
ncbi:hypothetical protein CHS0354_033674 [Potamilus streckersoni]|uniref:G-protein coupled receptors family 1 profile domain-containing protein n=1 Tax=Potamilus streckersoni TaxID=2493646 RepID=A0AAE0S206_9BIVA|nr:hypothetical protein CHS0354_033674 [Potamilus streckersoni]